MLIFGSFIHQTQMNLIMSNIAQNIKKIRELKNLKQKYVAEKLNTTQQTYSRYETGEISLNVNTLEKIAQILEVSIQDILSFDDKAIFNTHNHNTGENYTVGSYVVNDKNLLGNLKQQYESRLEDLKENIKDLKGQLLVKDKEIERLHQLLERALKN